MQKQNLFWKSLLWAFPLLISTSCDSEPEKHSMQERASELISQTQEQFAPDKRVALFDIHVKPAEDRVVLSGETNLKYALDTLKQRLERGEVAYVDSIQVLPSEHLKGKTRGLVPISVANLRAAPSHSSELVTQATLGTPLKVFKQDDQWYYVQTPDGYLAWVDSGGVSLFSPKDMESWRNASKLIYLDPFGFSYAQPDEKAAVVTDLVAGSILKVTGDTGGFYQVEYPNAKKAFIKKTAAKPYGEWKESLEISGSGLVETAQSLMGLPYLWGGTSSKGVDCSGYTKTVYFLNGMILPRDASQQIRAGVVVDTARNFTNLQKGDLLFFGRKATDSTEEKVVHVGMWIGDGKFIHSMGEVRISTTDTTHPDFDKYNYNRYLRTKRILGHQKEHVVQLTETGLFGNN